MSTQVEKATTDLKSVKIPLSTWMSVKHEATDRGANFYDLLAIAWMLFMELPEARRERLVRKAQANEESAA